MTVPKPANPKAGADAAGVESQKVNVSRNWSEASNTEREEKARRWQAEHADVIEWYNEHIDRDGIFGDEWRGVLSPG